MEKLRELEDFFEKPSKWQSVLVKLRMIIKSLPFEETFKWNAPVYTYQGRNLIGLRHFKSYVGLWFFQGVLLKDPTKKLINAQEGKTKALLQWHFLSEIDVLENKSLIIDYILETIENQKLGKQIKPKKIQTSNIPKLLKDCLDNDSDLKNLFGKLTPVRQKEYAIYIEEAKRETTRIKRLKQCIPLILMGKGLNDQYKNVN